MDEGSSNLLAPTFQQPLPGQASSVHQTSSTGSGSDKTCGLRNPTFDPIPPTRSDIGPLAAFDPESENVLVLPRNLTDAREFINAYLSGRAFHLLPARAYS